MEDSATLVAEADRFAAVGDLVRAKGLLIQAVDRGTNDPSVYLKLAGLHRALGEPDKALANVHGALALSPRDFTALLMEASILDQSEDPEAPQAWQRALAQQPAGQAPPHLQALLDKARGRVSDWTAARETNFTAVMAGAAESANAEEKLRLSRFRDNVLRKSKPFHSEPTAYHFPELTEREFHPRRLFPWLETLEAATDAIAAELQNAMVAERAELVPYIEYPDHLPLDQWRPLNKSRDWTAIHLVQNGERIEANARHCPQSLEILKAFDQPSIRGASPNAMFSLLAPKTRIPPHVGVNNARLVCHLPLIVPEGCWFRVGAQTRMWERGKAFVFDDTIEHEAMNPSDQLRVVFIFDVWNPELSQAERAGIAALVGSDASGNVGGL